ncbi:MAG: TIGR04283 family arsenosugar biosynthesis glycosyltransferase [Cyanobium sp.]
MAAPGLSVVIAARDEARRLPALLSQLAAAPELVREVWLVDGGSRDGTPRLASLAGARVLHSPPGRGRQLALGARLVSGRWLLLLHADVRLPAGWAERLAAVLASDRSRARAWYFQLAIAARSPALRMVEGAVRLRSRWRQQPYGDQGLLLPLALYRAVGGVRPLPLMEDLDLVLRLARRARLCSLGLALRVDGRRWQRQGVWRTSWSNLQLRRAWRRGVPAELLAQRYYGCS